MRKRNKGALPLPRYISPADIQLGDTVKVEWTVGDITHSRVAIVAERDYENSMRVFYSVSGQEIFRWHPAHNTVKCFLLQESPKTNESALTLFDMVESQA